MVVFDMRRHVDVAVSLTWMTIDATHEYRASSWAAPEAVATH
jgi:hypothetical protein